MMACRVCQAKLEKPVYEASAPALTSMMTFVDSPTVVYVCDACGHAQSCDLPDVDSFYDTDYRISLQSEDHDQIVGTSAEGDPIFRTDHQAALGLRLLDIPQGARVLDYGAAKATTLRKMVQARPDLHPHVFDVSHDYASAWQGWVRDEDQAIYEVPAAWHGRFNIIISHFVIEHVRDPIAFLKTLRDLLAPGGRILVSMPDVAANPGDMTVADHLNHFSVSSLKYSFALAGFTVEVIDTTAFPGAFFAVAVRNDVLEAPNVEPAEVLAGATKAQDICRFWERATRTIDEAAKRLNGCRAVIYGAGFYGSWINSRIVADIAPTAFLDLNPNLQGSMHFDRPVLVPADIDERTDVVFVGLNPLKARAIIAGQPALNKPGLDLVWIDG
ncbi:class I SAM-dependent methyltransferase [Rhizobium oryziradicis]|uniref:Methyltransferase type 12 n=1 Tax=Rhizobium oryziradicis TaxID=1867956 RepID=A0A1Q8ZT42_9HYPH|nr:class I SAM-dependent methyltransferase [Rhizobium oryziradicis]OLP45057.1 hypothetical protein BJF95_17010 [Rhizobium oryziradicis]